MPAPVILTRQANGLHTPISLNPLSVPASCQQITAEVFDATHTVVWSHDYLIWDALEDVNVFSLSTGKRIPSPDHTHMNTGQGYIVFVADDLIISDSTLRRKALPDVDVIAYHLPPNWSKTLEVRLNEGHSCIWRPSTGNSRASLSVPANISSEIIECDFNTPIPISVRCEEGVTLESASCASMPLRRVPVAQNSYLLEGAKYTSETLHRRLPLRLVFHRNGIPETHDSFVNCKPRGMLMRKNGTVHSFNPTENIDVYIAQNNHFRVFVPDSDDWILWEGLTPHGRVVERWRELPHFDGLGAPFTARAGNESEKRLPLAGSVIDCGVIDRYKIGTQDNGKRYITIYLHHPIENTEGVELRWWDKHWSMQRWEPEHLPKEAQWTIPLLPACHGDPLAVAISQNGVRVGASWSKRWYLEKCLMQPSHIGEAARNMRWLRLPILQPAARPHMQEFVAKAGDILRSFWLGDESIDGWVYNVRDAESWKRAARTLMDSEE